MRQRGSDIVRQVVYHGLFSCLVLGLGFIFPNTGAGETYGVNDPNGVFVPKVTVTVGKKDILIKKVDPQQTFRIIAIKLENRNLIRNVGLLNVEWINVNDVPGKPMPFAGPHYSPISKVFQDSMTKSAALRISERTNKELFAGKLPSDLISISVNEQPLVSSELASETDHTVKLDAGRDVSLRASKTTIEFNESNLKKGETIEVDNRSGMDQTIGVELPGRNLLYFQRIGRKNETAKIPEDQWNRFTLGADSGISMFLIPESDPASLAQLNGKEVVIKIYQGNKIKEAIRIPIKTSPDIGSVAAPKVGQGESSTEEARVPAKPEVNSKQQRVGDGQTDQSPDTSMPTQPATKGRGWGSTGLWIFQIVNLALLISLGAYGIFFMLPKMQVLQDRLAKNEMFIHGSREAIREELEEIKGEILRQCETKSSSES